MRNRKITIVIIITIILIVSFVFIKNSSRGVSEPAAKSEQSQIDYYTCGMHPSVRVSPEEYNKGNVNCPICNMKLTPIQKQDKMQEATEQEKILFYRNPMNPKITSQVPTKDEMGMDYIPVYEETGSDTEYYGCGMEGAEHVFQMKDAKGMKCPICGMPLIKLSKDEADTLKGVVSRVKIQGAQIQLAGVKTKSVGKLHLYKEIRTVGRVAYDPDLAIAQEEFISSLKALDRVSEGNIPEIKERTENLINSSKRKLRLLGLSEQQTVELEATREIQSSLILPEEKMWIYGDVYEYELAWLKEGAQVRVNTSSIPGEEFNGVISSVNSVLDPKTRSVRFRAEVSNPGLRLKPEMYVDVVIQSVYMSPEGEHLVLAIPKDAVLDTGVRKIVWLEKGNDEYEGRIIEVGPEAISTVEGQEVKFYPVLRGVSEGELVVTKANFLIDSQSQISGVASSAYSGALGADEQTTKAMPPGHQH
ncbi:MAG: efflux RND transporter periplasmic adaptor subunit [Candidatus Omnitrophota bacterium]